MLKQISEHKVAVFETVRKHGSWLSVAEIAERANILTPTVNQHCVDLVVRGLFEREPLFRDYRYRLVIQPDRLARVHRAEIEAAAKMGRPFTFLKLDQ
jgi:DNA-binding IclR family transcriptional regulator